MAEIILGTEAGTQSRQQMESIRFVQNVGKSELMIKDLGKKGIVFIPNEISDLQKFFTKKEISGSRHLEWAINNGHLRILEHVDQEDGTIKIKNALDDREKYRPRGESIPKDVPIEDKQESVFDSKLDEVEEREHQDDLETRPGRGRRDRNKEE